MTALETVLLPLLVAVACCLLPARAFCQRASAAQNGAADQWRFETHRPELAPAHWLDREVLCDGQPTLGLAGDGRAHANGKWVRTVEVAPGRWYGFEARFRAEGVREIDRSILARLLWFDAEGKQIGRAEYPQTLAGKDGGGWRTIRQEYLSPQEAAGANLELIYRWDADGKVRFGGVRFEPADAPRPRPVRLATVFHKPDARSAEGNLRQFADLVARAAELHADVVCLPEGATLYGTRHTYIDGAEPIPGPSTQFLGRVAARHKLYIVAGLFERAGPSVYNTAVLIDRTGGLIGSYRKVCLPREEIDGGVTPGDSFPVFQADFGKVGLMVCWDSQFPEPARALAMNGAEVIFLPIWGGNTTLTRARAIENQVYVVSCTYGMISAVFGLDGEILAEATAERPVAVVQVDLSERKLWPWLGHFRNRIRREMPPRSASRRADAE